MGSMPEKGVPDMTSISDIDEIGINRNLKVRYDRDEIYVSFLNSQKMERKYNWRLKNMWRIFLLFTVDFQASFFTISVLRIKTL